MPEISGQTCSLSQFYGEKLTVLFFWQSGGTMFAEIAAEDALESLAKDYAQPFAEKGVRVIGVNVGDPRQVAEQRITNAEAEFPHKHTETAVKATMAIILFIFSSHDRNHRR